MTDLRCVTWLSYTPRAPQVVGAPCWLEWDEIHSDVWHDSYETCDMTYLHANSKRLQSRGAEVWESMTCVTWLVRDMGHDSITRQQQMVVTVALRWLLCDMTHSDVWQDSFEMCDMTRLRASSERLLLRRTDSCVTWLIQMCDMTHLNVWYDSFKCVTWLIQTCAMTCEKCVTWLIHVWQTWLIHMCHDVWIYISCAYAHVSPSHPLGAAKEGHVRGDHDSYVRDVAYEMCDVSHTCVTWLIHVCHDIWTYLSFAPTRRSNRKRTCQRRSTVSSRNAPTTQGNVVFLKSWLHRHFLLSIQ